MTIFSNWRDGAPDGGVREGREAKVSSRAVEDFLRRSIQEGSLRAGEQLPPVREAGWRLGCAPGTVARAYKALVSSGLAYAQVGCGTFIGEGRDTLSIPLKSSGKAGIIDLSVNSFLMEPAEEALGEAFAAVTRSVRERRLSLSYCGPDSGGAEREAATGFLTRWRSDLTPDQVLVSAGAQALLAASFAALRPAGGALAVDALTYPGVISAAAFTGAKLHGIESDEQGMSAEALDHLCRRHPVSMLVTAPNVHNPTGGCMSAERRNELAEVARRYDLTVIEDEVYGFMAEKNLPGFSKLIPERTLLISSLSKCVAPAMRIGFAAGPASMIRRLGAAQNAMLLMVSPILGAAAAHILMSGCLESRIPAIRNGIKRRAAYIHERFPQLDMEKLVHGLAWLPVSHGWSGASFCQEAEGVGVKICPDDFFIVGRQASSRVLSDAGGDASAHVRISLGAVREEEDFQRAINVLATLARQSAPMPVSAFG